MERAEFIRRCEEANEFAGDQFERVVGHLMANFALGKATMIDTGDPVRDRLPEAVANAYVAMMMIQLKYNVDPSEIEMAIEKILDKK